MACDDGNVQQITQLSVAEDEDVWLVVVVCVVPGIIDPRPCFLRWDSFDRGLQRPFFLFQPFQLFLQTFFLLINIVQFLDNTLVGRVTSPGCRFYFGSSVCILNTSIRGRRW